MAKSVPSWPAFGSVVPPERRKYLEALDHCVRNPRGPLPARPWDPLYAYRETFGRRRKKPISVRIDAWVLDLIKAMADQHGMGYQTVLRMLAEEGLSRAMREGVPHGTRPEGLVPPGLLDDPERFRHELEEP
jgi:hypothetical protein